MARPGFRNLARDERILLALSACVGGVLGLIYANWQWAVELGQVQAGIVSYGPDAIPGLVQGTLWSLTNQLAGVLLLIGLSERAASAVVSCALGALWFEAVTLFIFALSRRAMFAFGATVLCFLSGASDYGAVYPSLAIAAPHTHGIVGLWIPILAVALLGAEWRRSGALLLGLAPAFHGTTGLAVIAFVGAAIFVTRRVSWPIYRDAVGYFMSGVCLTVLSLLLHLSMSPRLPAIDPESARRFFLAFVSFWDGHRRPVSWSSDSAHLAMGALGVAIAAALRSTGEKPRTTRFVLAFVAMCSVGSLLLSLLTWVPFDRLPMSIVAAMPGRVINMSAVTFAPLLFGLLGGLSQDRFTRATMVLLGSALLLSGNSALVVYAQDVLGFHDFHGVSRDTVFACGGIFVAALSLRASSGRTLVQRRPRPLAFAAATIVSAGVALWMLAPYAKVDQSDSLWDRSDESVLAVAARGQGLLLTGGELWLVQLRTRRPVLLDGGTLDTLSYAIKTGVLTDRVLREVYGVDLVHPPPDARNNGVVPDDTNQSVWERYSRARWVEIGKTFGVTQVLTKESWKLNLPLLAGGPGLSLYAIPGGP